MPAGEVQKRVLRLRLGVHVFGGDDRQASTFLVATTATPVPAASSSRTWPMETGAGTSTPFRARTTSKILPLGTSLRVLQETAGRTPPLTRTVLVTMRVGFVTSLRP